MADLRTAIRIAAARGLLARGLIAVFAAASPAHSDPLRIVAAESVYGDIARQIGGAEVAVTSILANPNQDPHEFEASASTARAIADARLVIYNGAGYDPWAPRLLAASKGKPREVIEVARLLNRKPGDNPHFWYDATAMSAFASTLAGKMSELDTAHKSAYAERGEAFEASIARLRERIAALRSKHAGTPVTATEPVFDYMAEALGLKMRNSRFQLAVMNGTEPSAVAIAAFEKDLRTRGVKLLLYNTQTTQALAQRMRAIAMEAGVPVIAITETAPQDRSYQAWMLALLEALDRALDRR
ncbi:MAG TPA: zinc ABC transporter substrate-binding protein [Casimicrobiaceae bacterium]|nr:zinc ABC transporter substrate-binding protein [Casimicrobiaceae bacterium]